MTRRTPGKRRAPRTPKIQKVDPPALAAGGLVAVGAVVVALLTILVHNLFFYDSTASAERGIAAAFTDALIFLGLLVVGLSAGTFLSVWRGTAPARNQATAAVVLHWLLCCGLGGAALAVLPGGSFSIFVLLVKLSPVFLFCQVVAALLAWLGTRLSTRLGTWIDWRTRNES